jgi:hypothetical protein
MDFLFAHNFVAEAGEHVCGLLLTAEVGRKWTGREQKWNNILGGNTTAAVYTLWQVLFFEVMVDRESTTCTLAGFYVLHVDDYSVEICTWLYHYMCLTPVQSDSLAVCTRKSRHTHVFAVVVKEASSCKYNCTAPKYIYCRLATLWMCPCVRNYGHFLSFVLSGKCVSRHITLFYHDKTMYQLLFCKIFRHPWLVVVSWPWQPWRSWDWGWSLRQRSNGSGGFSGGGLNITTRVSKSIMDAYTHPNWYPIGYIPISSRFFSSRFRGCE